MGNLTSSLGIGLSGLQASQEAMSVIGHNIANVNTPGYSQQSAVLTTNPTQDYGNLIFGTGVNVASIQSMRDQFLNLQVTSSISSQSGAQTRYNGVQAVSSAYQDNGTTGLNSQLSAFFSSLQTLSADPEDMSLRQNVVGTAQTLVQEFKSVYQTTTAQIQSTNQQVQSLVPEINTLTTQIASLNQQITNQVDPNAANDAIDQRQQLTDKLANLVGIQVSTDSAGNYQVTLDSGAATLVSGSASYQMAATPETNGSGMYAVGVTSGNASIDVTGKISGGELGGDLDLRDNILPGYQTQLDQIAGSLADQMNTQNLAGAGLNSNGNYVAGSLVFTTTGTTQPSIDPVTGQVTTSGGVPDYTGIVNALQVNPALVSNPGLIACAGKTTVGGVTTSNGDGDNTNILAMVNLQTATNTVDTSGTGTFSSGPFSTVISGLINKVGTQAQSFDTTATNQENLTTALQTQKTSVSGVDLDTQAAQLLAFQQAYQASAQFLSTISQLTNQLMSVMTTATA
jgi:flagellar hook-associated protein 1 FlgK